MSEVTPIRDGVSVDAAAQAAPVPGADVVRLQQITAQDLDPEMVLAKALEAGLTHVVVLGYDAAGDEYFASSIGDGGAVVWLAERAKLKLLRMADAR